MSFEDMEWEDEESLKDWVARWHARNSVITFVRELSDASTRRDTEVQTFVAALEKIISLEERFIETLKGAVQAMKKNHAEVVQMAKRDQRIIDQVQEGYFDNNNKIETLRTGYSSVHFIVKQIQNVLPKCAVCGMGLLQFHSDGSVGECTSRICPTNQEEE